MSAPPPDARESALDTLLEAIEGREYHAKHPDHDEMAREMTKRTQDFVSRARAELSALRASPPSVAREFVEAADAVSRTAWRYLRNPVIERQEVFTNALKALDALRPTATGEGDRLAAALRRYGQHISDMASLQNDTACASISLNLAKERVPNGRPCTCGLDAAIARAEGRKGT